MNGWLIALLVLLAWSALSAAVGFPLARSIRLADEMDEAERAAAFDPAAARESLRHPSTQGQA